MTKKKKLSETDEYMVDYVLATIRRTRAIVESQGYGNNARPWVPRRYTNERVNEEVIRRLLGDGYKDAYVEEHIEDIVFNVTW